ncbi:MAG: site-specific DNA-methyltransferase [Muribaculaceae bacterium]|nr:site-specific DNA-methyltransferase [Muribaculaceae bacterium]
MDNIDMQEWGTFKDCLKAPIYRWFTYPAGFSFKAAMHSFDQEKLVKGSTVYDPFMGSGTTNLAAKTMGINSYGVEAHPFVFPITKCKLNWNINIDKVYTELHNIKIKVRQTINISDEKKKAIVEQSFPELVLKCFLPNTLFELLIIRDYIRDIVDEDVKLFLNTGLICCLREVSIAATGWPYIAPNKIKITSLSKDGLGSYINFITKMLDDVHYFNFLYGDLTSEHHIFLGDSRDTTNIIPAETADHIFTSPPYLNNFDYADRTRLEMYFIGDANCWADICNNVRTKLITSATTQINRKDEKWQFSKDFITDNPEEYIFLKDAVENLGELRLTKGGKKSYDFLVLGYFNDLYKILKDNYRILKPNTTAKYILGDSAPYGVHIPTDELIAKIGCNIGFDSYRIDVLRTRGDKWKENPQRHNVKLRESIVTLFKKN